MIKKTTRPPIKKTTDPRPEVIEYIKKIINGTATHEDFLKLSADTRTAKGLKKLFSEIRVAIGYLKPA